MIKNNTIPDDGKSPYLRTSLAVAALAVGASGYALPRAWALAALVAVALGLGALVARGASCLSSARRGCRAARR
jgi:hypothetical protein